MLGDHQKAAINTKQWLQLFNGNNKESIKKDVFLMNSSSEFINSMCHLISYDFGLVYQEINLINFREFIRLRSYIADGLFFNVVLGGVRFPQHC